jgi:hypothetical protein
MRPGGMLKVTPGCINSAASRTETTAHCTTCRRSGKGTCDQGVMAGIQMRLCQWNLFQLPSLLIGFRWASTDVPWGDLDEDGIELPSGHGERVRFTFQSVVGPPANATLRDMKADEEREDPAPESEGEKD